MSLYAGTVSRRRRRTTEPYVYTAPTFVTLPEVERTVIAGDALAHDVTQQFSLTTGDLFDAWAAEQAGLTGGR